ncbi:MAG: hypothetical protein WDA74_09720 [Spirochaetota bacterium]
MTAKKLLTTIVFIGGLQLLRIDIAGQCLAEIYLETNIALLLVGQILMVYKLKFEKINKREYNF